MTEQTDPPRPSFVSGLLRVLIAGGLAALLVAYACYVQVREGEAAVVTRFGEPVRVLDEPGPHWKWPWPVENATPIDVRKRIFNTPYTATLTRDRRNVVLLTYVVWRVDDPRLFLQSLRDEAAAAAKLDGMVTAAKNTLMGRYDLSALVSTDASNIKTPEIEAGILSEVGPVAIEKFGIAVEQVGFKRIAYEEANVTAVLAQMRAEREAEAKELRAFGDKEASRIRDAAAVESEEILRDGRIAAGDIRGEAERAAAEIYGRAHRADPEFYRYWRSLEALKKTLTRDATIVLRTDQGFFDLLTSPPEEPARGSASTPWVAAERDRPRNGDGGRGRDDRGRDGGGGDE